MGRIPKMFANLRHRACRFWTPLFVNAWFAAQCVGAMAEKAEDLERLKERVLQLRDQSKWIEAMPLAEQLVVETTKQQGENTTNTAEALHYWAWLVQQNGDYDKAEQLWRQALAIDERLFGKDTVETTRRLHLLANVYREQGELQKAAPLLKRALVIREKHFGPKHPETAQILNSLGGLYALAGDFALAEAKLTQALKIFESAGPYYDQPIAGTVASLGWLYAAIGDFEQSERMMRRSLELRKKIYGLEHVYTAGGFYELAVMHRARRDFGRAEQLFHESLAIHEKLVGTNHILQADVLQDLGQTYLMEGDFAKAEPVLERARALVEQNLGPEHFRVAPILMLLSWLHESRGDYGVARELCARAHHIYEQHLGPSQHRTLASLCQLAHLDVVLGHPERALALAERLQQGEEDLSANILSFTSERQRLSRQRGATILPHPYGLWADLGAVKPLARAVFRTKGIVLDSLLEDRLLAQASDDKEIRELVGQITRARRRLGQLTSVIAIDRALTNRSLETKSIETEIGFREASLARRVAGFGQARRALRTEAEQVIGAIPEGAVLLEMVRYRHYSGNGRRQENYGVLIFARNAEPKWVRLGSAEAIEKSVKLFQHAVRNPGSSDALIDSLREIYERVWAPLSSSLPGRKKEMIISPDGELNFVSFATLLTASNRFLGEDYLFSYVSSGRDLTVTNKTASGTSELLVWANPDFGAAPPAAPETSTATSREGPFTRQRGLRGLSFHPLPGSQKEGERLRDCAQRLGFDKVILHAGANATEADLFRVDSPKALHLATHGFVLPETAPAADEDSFRASEGGVLPRMNPMLRSGLALAGAQVTLQAWSEGNEVPSDNDGIVTAEEIGGLNLHGTWLVVLSACDTGGGEARAGEGVLGLRRGFVQAGAQNLLLTLWPVDDSETVGLIPDFYAELRKTSSPPRALARVQRAWFEKLRAEKGVAEACRLAGPFILSFQGRLE
jgi:CHAT domain-containing protein/Tfp pilus assembly protein PilF